MRNRTLAEPDGNLQLVAGLQEFDSLVDLCVEIVGINRRKHTDFLDLHNLLVLAGFLFPLCLLKAELAVVHDPAHRRSRLGRDLDQIQILVIGNLLRFLCGKHTQLCSLIVDYQHLTVPDLFVDLMFLFANFQHLQVSFQNKNECRKHPALIRIPCKMGSY